ncbi:neutral/alkaline non-lysosomal ceramidase N-terminal domain-containing protein [candidate division KSB1 bacterium]|nr:neutral/alkaline non-lysosomal ceramidase N-terminal domain-containing protein [candidate division KSB1 bacterium]
MRTKIVTLACILAPALFAETISTLTAGAAAVNITPPVGIAMAGWVARERPSEAVADDLYAKALVISDQETTLALLTMDLLKTFPNIVSRVRMEVYRRTGIPPGNIMVTASHTHFSPVVDLNGSGPYERAYAETLVGKLAGVVQMAWQNQQPAWIGAGSGSAPEYTFNRRVTGKDGVLFNSWRFPADTTGLTFGPIDPEVGVLQVVAADNRPIASAINYATHPVCGMNELYSLSADYPAFAMQVVETIQGGICLFMLGAAGNQVPIKREGNSRVEIGRGVGAEALKTCQHLSVYNGFPLAVAHKTLAFSTRNNLFTPDEQIDLEIQTMALGDIVLVALPGEVAVEIGLELKARAGVKHLFVMTLANGGNVGYILRRIDYTDGGYEALNGSLPPGSGERIIEQTLGLISALAPVRNAGKTAKTRPANNVYGDISQKGYEAIQKKLQNQP